jgi:hypothetical protein
MSKGPMAGISTVDSCRLFQFKRRICGRELAA